MDEEWETECPVDGDGLHCTCWYDGYECCSCGADAEELD